MKRITISLLLLCLAPLMALAQKITVSGMVMDGSANDVLPGASVVLLQPKDSTQVTGVSSDLEGKFKLTGVKAGPYIMRVSYMGFQTQYKNLILKKDNRQMELGTITLQEDAKMMKEAEVVAKLAQVEMKADTFVYNSEAFRLPEGSALEELVRKLPGAEVSDDGSIKINGKSVSKIMVGGKEYFENDTKMAMKNLPSKLVKKIKAYDKKSDYSRITGIDDGEEETVLDLTVQKGMKDGWVANIDLGYGTQDRYTGKTNVNRFLDNSYLSIIGSRNNVNDGFGRWGGGGNGITTSTMGGVTFAWENGLPDYSAGLLKVGGNVRYSHSKSISDTRTNSEQFLPDGSSSFANSRNHSLNRNGNWNANFRLEWFPDSMTNIMFRPNFSHSEGNNFGHNESATFNQNPFDAGMTSPLDEYLDRYKAYKNTLSTTGSTSGTSDGKASSNIFVNGNDRYSFGDNQNNNVNGSLQANRRLGMAGRNITLNLSGGYSKSESFDYSRAMVRYFQPRPGQPDMTATYQNTSSPSENYNYAARLSYSEPIFRGANLQFSYQAQHRFQDSNREMMAYQDLADALANYGLSELSAYNLYTGQAGGVDLQNLGLDLTTLVKDVENSQYATYKELNQELNVMFRYNNKMDSGQELRFNAGVSYQPQTTKMDYQKNLIDTTVTRHIQNWAPRLDVRWKISNTSQLRVRYFGRMSQPSMTNLIEVTDSRDPLNISTGNAGLKSSWTDNFNIFYNGYLTEKQMGWAGNASLNINRRNISNSTIYDAESGGRYSRPMNINGNWNTGTWLMFNSALDKKKSFNASTNTNLDYSHHVGYISSNLDNGARAFLTTPTGVDMNGLFSYMDRQGLLNKSITKTTNIRENLRLNYRNDLMEIGVNGGFNFQHSRNDMQPNNNLDTWQFNYGGNVVLNLPWNMQLSSDISQQSRRGYDDASMNTNELIWNAQLSQNFMKGKAATVSVQWLDILQQRSNISRAISATMRSDTWTNAIHSYVMVHFIYRLNLLGSKEARNAGFGGPGGGPGGGGWGGPGGGPGGGGRGGRF